jgi:hypothetical protein
LLFVWDFGNDLRGISSGVWLFSAFFAVLKFVSAGVGRACICVLQFVGWLLFDDKRL